MSTHFVLVPMTASPIALRLRIPLPLEGSAFARNPLAHLHHLATAMRPAFMVNVSMIWSLWQSTRHAFQFGIIRTADDQPAARNFVTCHQTARMSIPIPESYQRLSLFSPNVVGPNGSDSRRLGLFADLPEARTFLYQ